VTDFVHEAWQQEEGQDVAEYAVMLAAVILATAVGMIRLIGSHASTRASAARFSRLKYDNVGIRVSRARGFISAPPRP